MEGDLNVVNSSEMSIYLTDTDDKYPKLIINGDKILNTSNECKYNVLYCYYYSEIEDLNII